MLRVPRILLSHPKLSAPCSLEVGDPLGFVEVGWVVYLKFLVNRGNLSLNLILVLGIDESELALGAVVR
jgi:hypothetical protein